jgi:hypothetical protein
MTEFRGLRWMPLQPKHLGYPNAQFLIIGEPQGLDHATKALDSDQKHGRETPLEEMEKLEGEDEIRVKHLKGKHTHQTILVGRMLTEEQVMMLSSLILASVRKNTQKSLLRGR